jgi:cell division protein FtsB
MKERLMQRFATMIFILCSLATGAFAQQQQAAQKPAVTPSAQSTATSRKLPPAQAAQLKEAQARIEALQKEIQLLNLTQQNIILSAALEMGMTKEELAASTLALDEAGNLVFIRRPPEQKAAGTNKK